MADCALRSMVTFCGKGTLNGDNFIPGIRASQWNCSPQLTNARLFHRECILLGDLRFKIGELFFTRHSYLHLVKDAEDENIEQVDVGKVDGGKIQAD